MAEPIIEVAFEMAKSGTYPTVIALITGLTKKGHPRADVEAQLFGAAIRKQLRDLINEARRSHALR